jgi:hypothetical protein
VSDYIVITSSLKLSEVDKQPYTNNKALAGCMNLTYNYVGAKAVDIREERSAATYSCGVPLGVHPIG